MSTPNTPSLATEAALARPFPNHRFNARERKVLASVKDYVDALSPDTVLTAQGDLIVGNASGDAARLAKGTSGLPLVAGASTLSYAALTATGLASGAVTLAKLDAGIAPSHIVKYAARYTTTGGAAAEAITLTGALAADLSFVRLVDDGTNNVTISSWAMSAGTLTVTFSGDPGNDAVIEYQVLRAAS